MLHVSHVATPYGIIIIGEENEKLNFCLWDKAKNNEKIIRRQLQNGKIELQETENHIIRNTKKQLIEYFSGERKVFDLFLNFAHLSPFSTKVLETLQQIPFSNTISYQQLAVLSGNEKAVRAVANVVANNPFHIIIPCHRVLPATLKIGNYAVGSNLKQTLLLHEKQCLKENG